MLLTDLLRRAAEGPGEEVEVVTAYLSAPCGSGGPRSAGAVLEVDEAAHRGRHDRDGAGAG